MRRSFLLRGGLLAASVVLALLGIGVLGVDRAGAHSVLRSSTPAAGSEVAAPPGSVVLTFNEGLLSASLTVTDACGRTVPAQAVVHDREVRAALRPAVAAPASGAWTVRWRIVGADGHAITGKVPFVVSGATDCASPDPPQPTATAAETGAEPGLSADLSANGPQTEDTVAVAVPDSRPVSVGVLVAVAALVLGLGMALLARRGRSSPVVREKP